MKFYSYYFYFYFIFSLHFILIRSNVYAFVCVYFEFVIVMVEFDSCVLLFPINFRVSFFLHPIRAKCTTWYGSECVVLTWFELCSCCPDTFLLHALLDIKFIALAMHNIFYVGSRWATVPLIPRKKYIPIILKTSRLKIRYKKQWPKRRKWQRKKRHMWFFRKLFNNALKESIYTMKSSFFNRTECVSRERESEFGVVQTFLDPFLFGSPILWFALYYSYQFSRTNSLRR